MPLLLVAATLVHAASVESLLMPGPLSARHAKYESDCSQCHDRANRERQSALCLACHKEIAADVQQKRGFHGRMPNAGQGQCSACHSEHQGRGADIVRFDTAQFDHASADFALTGAHKGVSCAGCHKPGAAWAAAKPGCVDCHHADDYHEGELGAGCNDCHTTDRWSGGRFDHGKTKFPLTGAHEQLDCGACHQGGHYKNAPRGCVGCHAVDDAHRGSRGEDCGNCHTTRDWKSARFDHEKETGFALLGTHAKVQCLSCHRSGDYKAKIPKDCLGCHRADDAHGRRFGDKCDSCHSNEAWKPVKYDHAARAKFALEGVHARLDCHACHTAVVAKQKLGTECIACHRAADPHGGGLGRQCGTCHLQESWHAGIVFDHDLSGFPLLGLHSAVACAQCHRTLAFKPAPARCIDCHRANDVHKGGLGEKCDSCHSPNGWSLWNFDHFRQTGFALSGAHARNQCSDCHRRPAGEVKLSKDCVSCHQKDDIHAGQFGRQCDRCHTTSTFQGGKAR